VGPAFFVSGARNGEGWCVEMTREHSQERPSPGQAWERRPDESRPAYDGFVAYYRMGQDRSLRRLAEVLAKALSLLGRWSSTYDWPARVREWEEQERREAAREKRHLSEQTRQRREENAEQLERVAMVGLRSLVVRDPATGEPRFDQRLKPAEVAALIRVACQLLPTPHEQPPPEGDEADPLGDFSDEDLQQLNDMLQEGLDEPQEQADGRSQEQGAAEPGGQA